MNLRQTHTHFNTKQINIGEKREKEKRESDPLFQNLANVLSATNLRKRKIPRIHTLSPTSSQQD